jgi:hypothetical protein
MHWTGMLRQVRGSTAWQGFAKKASCLCCAEISAERLCFCVFCISKGTWRVGDHCSMSDLTDTPMRAVQQTVIVGTDSSTCSVAA